MKNPLINRIIHSSSIYVVEFTAFEELKLSCMFCIYRKIMFQFVSIKIVSWFLSIVLQSFVTHLQITKNKNKQKKTPLTT